MSEKTDTQPSLSTVQQDAIVAASRRTFLRRMAIGGGLALGVGGAAAYFANQGRATVVVLPNGDAVRVPTGTEVDETMDLINQLAALKTALAESDEERRSLADQLTDALAEVDRLNGEREGLLSLVALYESLDGVGLDDIVSSGFLAVDVGMAAARRLVGLLETGLGSGLSALSTLVDNFPTPQAGLIWLKGEVTALIINLENVAERIKDVIEPVEPLATLVFQFIMDVLRKLPFGLGNPARGGLEAMQSVIAGLPPLADGIAADIFNPLEVWFGQDNKTNLLGTLVSPIEDDVMTPATDTVASFTTLAESYENDLVTPVQTAIDQRLSIRTQIDQQRAQLSGTLLAYTPRRAG